LLVALLSKAHYKHAMQGVSTHKHKPSIGHSCVLLVYAWKGLWNVPLALL
jgi:hypothetical protein